MLTRNLTLSILGGAVLAALAAEACGSLNQGQTDETGASQQTLQSSLEPMDEVPAGYARVPGGLLVHKDCIHEIPDNAEVGLDLSVTVKGQKVAQFAQCAHKAYRFARKGEGAASGAAAAPANPATGNGWVEASWANSTQSEFTHMDSGSWTVPAAPSRNDSQTIFFFPSFTSSSAIVQPVLQWGSSGAGGGQFWGMANWYVVGNGSVTALHSSLATVSTNDVITGTLNITGQSSTAQTWQVAYRDWTKGIATTSSFTTNANLFNAVQGGVLEAYNIVNCSDFPSGSSGLTYFSAPTLYQGNSYTDRNFINPSWSAFGYTSWGWTGPVCGFAVSVDSRGSTWLYY